ncbi:MAG: sigma-70 family RNA polymerase sigma factor [Mangrovibacterium sp.]|nr:sigma-70 family RNA polymerase sigma factor [Mangrovibacterium sp.]
MKNQLPPPRTESQWSELWARFKNGDPNAFGIIYNEHIDFLFNYGKSITKNVEIIEDSIQDLFLYLLSEKDQIITPNYVRYYLLKAYKRILIEKIRSERKTVDRIDDGAIDFELEIETEGIEEKQIEERKIALIEKLIENLDPQKKEIIFLKFQSGLSYAEISDIVGIRPSSAKQVVYRVMSSFHEIIKDQAIELLFLFFKRVRR